MGIFKRLVESYNKKIAIMKHRKMWRWLAKYPGMEKEDYFEIHGLSVPHVHECYACTYAEMISEPYYERCDHCPLDWNGRDCMKNDSLFCDWYDAETLEARAIAAKMIAELPERK